MNILNKIMQNDDTYKDKTWIFTIFLTTQKLEKIS